MFIYYYYFGFSTVTLFDLMWQAFMGVPCAARASAVVSPHAPEHPCLSQLRELLDGRLPLPEGGCKDPSDLMVAIGACPTILAQRALQDRRQSVSASPRATSWFTPEDSEDWLRIAKAWFRANEYSFAVPAFEIALQLGFARSGINADADGSGSTAPSHRHGDARVVEVEHHLGAIAGSWGLLSTAQQLLLNAAHRDSCSPSTSAAMRVKALLQVCR